MRCDIFAIDGITSACCYPRIAARKIFRSYFVRSFSLGNHLGQLRSWPFPSLPVSPWFSPRSVMWAKTNQVRHLSRNQGFISMIVAFELVIAISAAYFVVSGAIERLKKY